MNTKDIGSPSGSQHFWTRDPIPVPDWDSTGPVAYQSAGPYIENTLEQVEALRFS